MRFYDGDKLEALATFLQVKCEHLSVWSDDAIMLKPLYLSEREDLKPYFDKEFRVSNRPLKHFKEIGRQAGYVISIEN